MALEITGDPLVRFSPGILMVDLGNGEPFVSVDLFIDSGPVLVSVVLDETGSAASVVVPVSVPAGAHTLNVANS